MHRVSGAWKFAFLSDAIHMAREHRQNAIQYLYFTSFNNKVFCDIAYFNTKCHISQISNEQKVRHLEQPSRRVTKWTKHVWSSANNTNERLTFLKFDYRKTSTSYFFTNLHAIYVWNGHRERRFSHWYLQLHNDIHVGGAVLICIAIDFMLPWHTRSFQYSL